MHFNTILLTTDYTPKSQKSLNLSYTKKTSVTFPLTTLLNVALTRKRRGATGVYTSSALPCHNDFSTKCFFSVKRRFHVQEKNV